MGDIHWWGEERPKLDCQDYKIGEYKPVSFESKLKWEITHSEPTERFFIAKATLYFNDDESPAQLIVRTSNGFGRMRRITTGMPHNWDRSLDTNDPEEAMYIAEQDALEDAKGWIDYYKSLMEIIG